MTLLGVFLKEMRITGWRRWLGGWFLWLTAGRDRRDRDFCEVYLDPYTITNKRREACRVLGLPDNWVYNEERLVLARGPDALTTWQAVGYLINLHSDPAALARMAR